MKILTSQITPDPRQSEPPMKTISDTTPDGRFGVGEMNLYSRRVCVCV